MPVGIRERGEAAAGLQDASALDSNTSQEEAAGNWSHGFQVALMGALWRPRVKT